MLISNSNLWSPMPYAYDLCRQRDQNNQVRWFTFCILLFCYSLIPTAPLLQKNLVLVAEAKTERRKYVLYSMSMNDLKKWNIIDVTTILWLIHKRICKIPFQKFTARVWEKQTIFLMHFEFMKNMFEVQTGADNDIYMWSVPICFV